MPPQPSLTADVLRTAFLEGAAGRRLNTGVSHRFRDRIAVGSIEADLTRACFIR